MDNSINNINFKGTFLIKKPSPEIKGAILTALDKTKKQIFDDFLNKGDSLYVVRNSSDRNIANIIIGIPNIKFKYYPELNTKSGFDSQDHKGAAELIKNYAEEVITTKEKLLEKIKKPVNFAKPNIKGIQEKNLELIQKETFIDFNDDKYIKNIDEQTGVCTIKVFTDNKYSGIKKKHTLVRISPPGKFGYCYAEYTPLSLEEPTRRIAINKNGEKMFEYVNSNCDSYIEALSQQKSFLKNFEDNFSQAKKYYREQFAKKVDTIA